jgi:chemotaxis protein MotB
MNLTDMDSPHPAPRRRREGIIIPQYMGTFADLMTLLLCFFVLLVAMAEIDALKFKMVVRSMENAFGVERPHPVEPERKATSVIQQQFSPTPDNARPEVEIWQDADNTRAQLKKQASAEYQAAQRQQLQQLLQQRFADALDAKLFSLETREDRVLIRINEQASFPSGSASLKATFLPLLSRLGSALLEIDASFVVSGHTDNVPLRSGLYRSNWELSAARATSVVHALLNQSGLQASQFRIEAYADTQPLGSNATATGRAQNRRVEIGIINPWS